MFIFIVGIVGLASFFLFAISSILDWDMLAKFWGVISILGIGTCMVSTLIYVVVEFSLIIKGG